MFLKVEASSGRSLSLLAQQRKLSRPFRSDLFRNPQHAGDEYNILPSVVARVTSNIEDQHFKIEKARTANIFAYY